MKATALTPRLREHGSGYRTHRCGGWSPAAPERLNLRLLMVQRENLACEPGALVRRTDRVCSGKWAQTGTSAKGSWL